MFLNYFREHSELGIAFVFIIILKIVDITTTFVALSLPPRNGIYFIEGNPVGVMILSNGWLTFTIASIVFTAIILASTFVFWQLLYKKFPHNSKYFLFIVAIGSSSLVNAVVNNFELLFRWYVG